jgi:hypothetical protein
MSDRPDKPILCLDFDGVIHRYDSGWKGPCEIPDDVTDGFFEWLDVAAQHFRIVVYSSRSKEPGACDAMAMWMAEQRRKWREAGGKSPITDGSEVKVEFAHEKPAAFLTIDDRGMTFDGDWSHYKPEHLRRFLPWNKMPEAGPHNCAEQMHWHLNLQHFGDTNIKYLEVQGQCRACGRKARFRGPAGIDPAHPTVTLDGTEASFPLLIGEEAYDGKGVGFSVTSPRAN